MPQPQPSAGAWAVMGPARQGFLHMQGKSHQGRHGYMHESSHMDPMRMDMNCK